MSAFARLAERGGYDDEIARIFCRTRRAATERFAFTVATGGLPFRRFEFSEFNMPRFAILIHDHPFLHWDLLVEQAGVLQAWRLLESPGRWLQSPCLQHAGLLNEQ
ncbi:MAG TPA: hypothetical protein VK137_11370, partial [Planctomycetaceae bacterium]|nr:hypothetical protein [Planctomycetaceae bacterium]